MAYDGEGNRVALKVNGGTPTYYIGGLEEISGSTLTKYLGGGGGLPTAERVGTSGSLTYLASDGLGSLSEALDGSGTVTFQQLFTPYGGSRYSSGSSPTSYAFTGQRADSASGLDYDNARYYDPVAGQFGSADTVLDGLNRFGYVGGNPTTLTDPSGHSVAPAFRTEAGTAAAVGVGILITIAAAVDLDRLAQTPPLPITPTSASISAAHRQYGIGGPLWDTDAPITTTPTTPTTPTGHGHPSGHPHPHPGGGGAGAGKPPRQTHGNPCEPGGSGGDGLPEFTGSPTTGNFVGPNGESQIFQSGHSLTDISLQPRQLFPDEWPGMVRKFGGWDHAEAQAATHMRLTGLQEGDLWINNPSGPCDGPFSCDTNLHHMLPEGATLRVHWPGGEGDADMCREYTGTPDSEWNGYEP